VSLDRLWNGWRSAYVRGHNDGSTTGVASDGEGSVFTRILMSGLDDVATHIVHRGETVFAIMNAFPYASGHLLVLPYREVADLEGLTPVESAELWATVTDAVTALKISHRPTALNVGINLGASAGGSVSEHLHVHVVPRWEGDANFMTAVANTRTLPEPLEESASRLRAAWPSAGAGTSAGHGRAGDRQTGASR
jgi:diadenosine tetraphosphate (Ap4A) HIT family hydrolase